MKSNAKYIQIKIKPAIERKTKEVSKTSKKVILIGYISGLKLMEITR